MIENGLPYASIPSVTVDQWVGKPFLRGGIRSMPLEDSRGITVQPTPRTLRIVTDRRYGAIPGSAYWRHLMIGA